MAKIIAPNKGYTGVSASVPFVKGVGSTDNLKLVNWFKNHGYEVVEEKESKKDEQSKNSKKVAKVEAEQVDTEVSYEVVEVDK